MLSKIERWVSAWIQLFEGIVVILSFAYFYPGWHTSFIIWRLLKQCEKAEREHIKRRTKQMIGRGIRY